MDVIEWRLKSEVLKRPTGVTVLLPERASHSGSAEAGGFPTLYLLHGLGGDHRSWLLETSIARYAEGLIVIMPDIGRSFGTDERYGSPYWTFLTEELPEWCRALPISTRREDTYVGGVSMGGHVAVKWALRDRNRFAAVASLAGSLGLADRLRGVGPNGFEPELRATIFGDRPGIDGTPDDVHWLLEQAVKDRPGELPAIYIGCGTEDSLYAESVGFVRRAGECGVPVTVDFTPGEHNWADWDRRAPGVITWLRSAGSTGSKPS